MVYYPFWVKDVSPTAAGESSAPLLNFSGNLRKHSPENGNLECPAAVYLYSVRYSMGFPLDDMAFLN